MCCVYLGTLELSKIELYIYIGYFFFIVNVNSIGSVSAIEAKGCLEVKCMVDTIYTLAQQYVIHMGATENAILIWRYLKYTDREVTIFK